MSLDEKQHPKSSNEDTSIQPWPLSTDAVLKVLAWPKYDELESLQRILMVAEPLFDNKNGCLCLRHDPETDIPYDQAVGQLQRAFEVSGRTGDLEVLFIDEQMTPSDWPRLGKSINAAISLDDPLDERHASFFSALGVEIISGTDSGAAD